jgi:hypothetical protein
MVPPPVVCILYFILSIQFGGVSFFMVGGFYNHIMSYLSQIMKIFVNKPNFTMKPTHFDMGLRIFFATHLEEPHLFIKSSSIIALYFLVNYISLT